MIHIINTLRRPLRNVLTLALLASAASAVAAQEHKMKLDLFSGFTFDFRDINYYSQYDLLIRLTPGFRFDMGNHFELTGQARVTVLNQYEELAAGSSVVSLSNLALSKQFRLGDFYGRLSGGVFSKDRYGLDLKAFYPVTRWLAFEAQLGCTGRFYIDGGINASSMNRLTGTLGGDIYLTRWNTQLRGRVGRYIYEDYGVECSVMRHFRHTTVGLFGLWNDYDGYNAGFTVTIMLPPYRRSGRFLTVRPASNFSLNYGVLSHPYTNQMYDTDPEQNLRDGWFSRDLLQWGAATMQPDFTIKGEEAAL